MPRLAWTFAVRITFIMTSSNSLTWYAFFFWSIVYNRVNEDIRQNLLMLSTWLSLTIEIKPRVFFFFFFFFFFVCLFVCCCFFFVWFFFYEIQVTVIYSRAILSLWYQSAVDRGSSVKPGLGHWQTTRTQIRRHRTWSLVWFCTVCLNYRKLKVKTPFRTIFPAYT